MSTQPMTAAARALLERLDRYELRRGGAPKSWFDSILAIEAEMYDLASNEGYHAGIQDCKEHDPAHTVREAQRSGPAVKS